MKSVGAVQKPNWDSMTPQEAHQRLLEVNGKIATLELYNMKWGDYRAVSKRLFEEKRRCLARINNPPIPQKIAEMETKKKINQHRGLSNEDCQKLLDKMK